MSKTKKSLQTKTRAQAPLMTPQSRAALKADPYPHSTPMHSQLAALCWRVADGQRQVLLVTSSNGRWILPKGWPIGGKTAGATAMTEAWEEAGVTKGKVSRRPVGSFVATKRTPSGDDEPCMLHVYAIRVQKTAQDYPDRAARDRIWVSPADAEAMVDEDGLRDILVAFRKSE